MDDDEEYCEVLFQFIVLLTETEFHTLFLGMILGFFLCSFIVIRCRSPPFYQFELKKQIDRRK